LTRQTHREWYETVTAMSDGNPQELQFRADSAAEDRLQGLQFSLAEVFVATTVMAVILSGYFGVGRWLGMSNREIVTQGLSRLLYVVPTLLVWIVGLMMAIRRLRRNRLAATLTIVALSGLMLGMFVAQVVQMGLIYWVTSNRADSSVLSWGFAITGIVSSILSTACWILLLAAIFARRPPDDPPAERSVSDGDPFVRGET